MSSVNREGDLVLVHYEGRPAVYARIQTIEPDLKKDWFRVTMLMLTIPHQLVTWILREEYINGEQFTMGGKPVKLEKVDVAPTAREPEENQPASRGPKKSPKVVAFKKQH